MLAEKSISCSVFTNIVSLEPELGDAGSVKRGLSTIKNILVLGVRWICYGNQVLDGLLVM